MGNKLTEQERKSRQKMYGRRADLKRRYQGRKYGLKPGDAERMKAEQNYKCAICREQFDGAILGARSAVIDHSHNTGKVRGVLCQGCNLGLGAFRDNPDYLSNARDYLAITGG